MMRTNPALLKAELHCQLQNNYKTFFESKIAVDLLSQGNQFVSVHKISNAILQLIEKNKETVLGVIANDAKVIGDLREPFFGSLYNDKEVIKPSDVLEKLIFILNNEKSDLKNVIQIHSIFIYRIYDKLETGSKKSELTKQLFHTSLFSEEFRKKTENKKEQQTLTHQLGICTQPVFCKWIGQSNKKHLRALEKFSIDSNSLFFKSVTQKNLPYVCGPSGHTGSLLLGAKLYGNLNAEQFKEYAWVCFAFLAAGGNHSFYEVMLVAAQAGIDVKAYNYAESIPFSFKDYDFFKKLSCRFPEFLTRENDGISLGK